MRLNAYLARAGVSSRRKADELIKAGRVRVNGEPGELNTFVASGDRVEVDGRPVEKQRLAYLLLHKPAGVVTTARDPQGRPTVVDLVPRDPRVVPVVSASSRPTGTTRGSRGTRSTTVGRPGGSRAVVTTPAGLCSRR